MEKYTKSLDWDAFYSAVQNLAEKVKKSGFRPSILIAVARGGWIPVRFLSDSMGIKKIASVGLTYRDKDRKELELYSFPEPIDQNSSVLLVEDCLESGNSLFHAKVILQQRGATIKTASLFTTAKTTEDPDFFLERLDLPPRFPWEKK